MAKVIVKDLHKSYGDNEVLKGLNLEVQDNEVVCMIGPSGSGKSTFLRCLNDLEVPTQGQVVISGYDLSDKGTNINLVRENIGMVFQHFNLFPHLSVLQNITLAPTQLKRKVNRKLRKRRVTYLPRSACPIRRMPCLSPCLVGKSSGWPSLER